MHSKIPSKLERFEYTPPIFFSNPHIQTIYSSICRTVSPIQYKRERILTPDNDFLDLDWAVNLNANLNINSKENLVIISHGLEGNSKRKYVLGMINKMHSLGWDALAWNYRGCGLLDGGLASPNKNIYSYHSGFSEDLKTVIEHVRKTTKYKKIFLIGFSVGGNITLKYLAENPNSSIVSSVVFSVPLDLAESAKVLAKKKNFIYMQYFLRQLREKIVAKNKMFPDQISEKDWFLIKNFEDFDNRYTAPLFKYKSAEEYWHKNSSLFLLNKIKVPSLIVSALDDPFLGRNCFPYDSVRDSEYLFLETPKHGGHVGFISRGAYYWSEVRAANFLLCS